MIRSHQTAQCAISPLCIGSNELVWRLFLSLAPDHKNGVSTLCPIALFCMTLSSNSRSGQGELRYETRMMKETWPDQRKDKENTLREQLQGPILETRDLWNIWSDWRGDMTWPTNTNIKTMTKTNTLRELLQGPIIETCELWDILPEWWGDMTWQTKTMIMTMAKTNTFREHLRRAILDTYDLWDTDFNFNNWKPDIMTIIVTWPLRVTLERITMFVFFCSCITDSEQ